MPRYPLENIQRRKQEDRAARPVKQWDADKLGCVLETSWHSYRQTVVGSWQMLLDCPAARTSPVFFYLFFFLSRFPRSLSFHHFLPPLLFLRQKYVDALKFSADSGERSLEKSRERLVESDSNRVRTAQPWKRQTIRARSASSSGKEFCWTRESLYSTILVRACCGLIFILNVSWLLPISFYVPIFFFRSSDISFPVDTIFIGLCM